MNKTIVFALGGLALTGCVSTQEIHADVKLANGKVATLVGNTLYKDGYALGGDELLMGKGVYEGKTFYVHNGEGDDGTKMIVTSDPEEIKTIKENM